MKNVQVITIESDFGAGKKGAKFGPQALLNALPHSLKVNLEIEVVNTGELIEKETLPGNNARNIDSILEIQNQAIQAIQKAMRHNKMPWIISGDHSNGLAAISAYKNAFPDNRLGVIWIDAHADLHTPFTSPSGNVHGMPLAAALGLTRSSISKNEVDKNALALWEAMLSLGDKKLSPKIKPEDLVFIELRDLEHEETELLNELSILHFTPQARKESGLNSILDKTRKQLENCDHILVSFDVDSLDPSVSYGTGTPVPGGLLKSEAVDLLTELLKLQNLFAFEITEINPLLDRTTPMEEVAAEIITACFEKSGFLNQLS